MKYVYIKLTNKCNLKCKHCYNDQMHNLDSMNEDVLEQTIIFLKKFKAKHPNDEIELSLHGGEPLLYPIDKIKHLVLSTADLNFKWSLTTNLIYELTRDHFELFSLMCPFEDNHPYILTSWDYKIRFNGNQETQWEKNVSELLKNKIEVQPIICLTNLLIRDKTPQELFEYMSNLGIKNLNFERITLSGRAAQNNLRPLNSELNEWLYTAYLIYKDYNINIPLFESIEQSIKLNYIGCRARQCMTNVVTINPDGMLSSCPNIASFTFGNILSGLMDNHKRQILISKESTLNNECYICKYKPFCNGDCCQLQFDETGCPGLIKIYSHLI